MINTFLPTVTHPLTQDMVRGLRTFTRELREYIEANLNHYPPTFYQKKADGKCTSIVLHLFYHSHEKNLY